MNVCNGLGRALGRVNRLVTESYAQFASKTRIEHQNWHHGKLDSAALWERLAAPLSTLRQDIDHLTALRDSQYERFRLILEQ